MATGVDESAYLGSAVESIPVTENTQKNNDRVQALVEKRKSTYAVLEPAISTLQVILAETIKKESNVNTIRERAQRRAKAEGASLRDALADEMLHSTGRLEMANELEQLFANVKRESRGNDEQ